MPPTDQEIIMGELRAIRRGQEALSFAMRIDTPWVKAREHVAHALAVARTIPTLARWALIAGAVLLTWGAVYRSGKAAAVGIDLLFVSLLFVGVEA